MFSSDSPALSTLASEEANPRIGLLGELAVEMQIVQRGWHPVRLDTAQMASNADLIAVNRQHRVSIQVKTTNAESQHTVDESAKWLGFGYATGYLRDGKPIFNSKNSPLIADVVIGVSYHPNRTRFVVLPVAFAETLCRIHCDYWASVPTRGGSKRSQSFPVYLPFMANRHAHGEHFDRVKQHVLKFENAWDVLFADVATLHDSAKWPMLS